MRDIFFIISSETRQAGKQRYIKSGTDFIEGKDINRFFTVASLFIICVAVLFVWYGEEFLEYGSDSACENPQVVVVLAGSPHEDPGRVVEGAALFEDKSADYLMFPLRHPAIKWTWLVKKYGVKKNIPKEKVLFGRARVKDQKTDRDLGGTFNEAEMTIRLMEEKKITSAVVVTSGYHIRRSRLAFQRALKGRDLSFCFHGVKRKAGMGPWWLDREQLFRVIGEYKKLIGAYFMYK